MQFLRCVLFAVAWIALTLVRPPPLAQPTQCPLHGRRTRAQVPALADMPTAETFNMTWLGPNNWTGLDVNYTCPSNVYNNYTNANSGGPVYSGGTFLLNQGMYLKSVVCHWTFCAAAPALQIRFARPCAPA
jgi:hypothetical protein